MMTRAERRKFADSLSENDALNLSYALLESILYRHEPLARREARELVRQVRKPDDGFGYDDPYKALQ